MTNLQAALLNAGLSTAAEMAHNLRQTRPTCRINKVGGLAFRNLPTKPGVYRAMTVAGNTKSVSVSSDGTYSLC